jgi:hypothetical protein
LGLFCFLLALFSLILSSMNKSLIFYFSVLAFSISIFSCGPAAEDRQAMHVRAKVFQDSIANSIRSTMAEAEGPVPMSSPINTAAPIQTTQAK